ncbi:A24 family peptidase [Polaromonas sp.]|uniref:A24 family peptidase n=1 Tax=Polaromonas sp. TaxID=1869339 RepID=UPI002FCADE8F
MRLDVSYEGWQLWSLVALALIVLTAVLTDVRQQRIPNTLILLALCAGVLVNVLGPEAGKRSAGLFTYYPGALGLKGALLGALTGLAVFLPFYVLRAMGAGDVKLMAGVGSFVGPATLLNVALCVLLMGGVLAVVRMVWKGSSRKVLSNVGTVLLLLLPPFNTMGQRFDPATQSADRMPYALAVAAGLLAYGAWIYSGHLPLIGL